MYVCAREYDMVYVHARNMDKHRRILWPQGIRVAQQLTLLAAAEAAVQRATMLEMDDMMTQRDQRR